MSRNSFVVDISKIASASVVSQIIILATTPIFTRLFSPSFVGAASVFMAIVFSLAPVSSLSYNQALVLAKNDREAAALTVLSFLLVLALTIILIIPFGLFSDFFFGLNLGPELRPYLWLIPISVFIRGTGAILIMESSRLGEFGLQGRSKIIQTVSERVFVLGPGLLGKTGALVIIIGRLISYIFEAAAFYRLLAANISRTRNVTWRILKEVAYRYREFPLYANWTNLTANLSAYVSIFIIAFFFTAEFTGLYAISERLLFLPLIIFGESIKSVYFRKATIQQNDPDQLSLFFAHMRDRLIAYSIFPMITILFFGTEIFGLFLGAKWEAAGHVAGILCLFAFFQLISSPVMSLVNVLGKQREFFFFTCLLLSVKFISFIVGGLMRNPMTALWLVTISGSMTYLVIHCWIDKLLGMHHRNLFIQLAKHTMLTFTTLGAVLALQRLHSDPLFLLFILGCASLVYYAVAIHVMEGTSILMILRRIKTMSSST